MLRTILWYLNFVLSLIVKIPKMFKMKRLQKTLSNEEFLKQINIITSDWSKQHIKMAGAKVHITGEENIPDETVLFVSNHQSNFDIAIFMALIKKDKGFIAKSELLKVPLLRTWMTYLNCIFMDRKDLRSSGKAIVDGIKVLKEGYSLVVFPEGTRSKSSTMGEFKCTSLKLATKSKVPIVPVTVDGTYKIMEANNNRIKPSEVYITIHKPIETDNIKNNEVEELCERVVEVIKNKIHT